MNTIPGTQDVFGQIPRLKGYTHLVLCFHHSENSWSQERTIAALRGATSRITTALPWIGGAVVHTGASTGHTGTFSVVQSPETEQILRVQDRSDACPSYEEIINQQGASHQLDVSLLSTETSLPDRYVEKRECPASVLTLTASWINGGLVLDCAAQHNILDMGGIDQFLRLLTTSLQMESAEETQELSPRVIEINLRDRITLFPLLRPDEERCDHSEVRDPQTRINARQPPQLGLPSRMENPSTRPEFRYFRIKDSDLEILKSLAKTPSADDALSAFIWKSLSAVRQRHIHQDSNANVESGFTRAIDTRNFIGVPSEYMGQMAVKTCTKMTLSQLEQSSYAAIAAHLRKDVERIRDRYWLRSLATLIDEEKDKRTFNFGKGFDPETWINASSWAGVAGYRLTFGSLGKPAMIRRPNAKPVQGILIFLPRLENGDMDILLC